MKTFFMALTILLVFITLASWITGITWGTWWYPKTYEYALKLADDASLPEVKAKYLREYRDTVSKITGPPRYVFTRPNLDTKLQLQILDGLIKRFEDISKIQPSEMAYQQGMYQLTGQELDHQLKNISRIFFSAKLRESPIVFFWIYIVGWTSWILATVAICFLSYYWG